MNELFDQPNIMLDNVWRMDCGLDKAQSRETLASSQRITLSFGKMVIYYAHFGCNSMDHGHGYHYIGHMVHILK